MQRSGSLPAQCIACNQPAASHVRRKLCCAPAAWRYGALSAPFVLLAVSIGFNLPTLAVLFLPFALLLAVVHVFVRRKFELQIPLCARHRRAGDILTAVSIALMASVILVPLVLGTAGVTLLWIAIVALLAVGVAQRLLGIQALTLRKLTQEHASLGGAGDAFRQALPEFPG